MAFSLFAEPPHVNLPLHLLSLLSSCFLAHCCYCPPLQSFAIHAGYGIAVAAAPHARAARPVESALALVGFGVSELDLGLAGYGDGGAASDGDEIVGADDDGDHPAHSVCIGCENHLQIGYGAAGERKKKQKS